MEGESLKWKKRTFSLDKNTFQIGALTLAF